MQRQRPLELADRLPKIFAKLGMGTMLLFLLLVAGALLIGFVRLTWTEHQINQAIARQEAANAAQRHTNDVLKGQADYSESDIAAERIARERLGMARDGEIVLQPNMVVAPAPTPKTSQPVVLNSQSSPATVTHSATASNALHWWHALFPGANAQP